MRLKRERLIKSPTKRPKLLMNMKKLRELTRATTITERKVRRDPTEFTPKAVREEEATGAAVETEEAATEVSTAREEAATEESTAREEVATEVATEVGTAREEVEEEIEEEATPEVAEVANLEKMSTKTDSKP